MYCICLYVMLYFTIGQNTVDWVIRVNCILLHSYIYSTILRMLLSPMGVNQLLASLHPRYCKGKSFYIFTFTKTTKIFYFVYFFLRDCQGNMCWFNTLYECFWEGGGSVLHEFGRNFCFNIIFYCNFATTIFWLQILYYYLSLKAWHQILIIAGKTRRHSLCYLRYESSTLILYKELSSTIFQSCQSVSQSVRHR